MKGSAITGPVGKEAAELWPVSLRPQTRRHTKSPNQSYSVSPPTPVLSCKRRSKLGGSFHRFSWEFKTGDYVHFRSPGVHSGTEDYYCAVAIEETNELTIPNNSGCLRKILCRSWEFGNDERRARLIEHGRNPKILGFLLPRIRS